MWEAHYVRQRAVTHPAKVVAARSAPPTKIEIPVHYTPMRGNVYCSRRMKADDPNNTPPHGVDTKD